MTYIQKQMRSLQEKTLFSSEDEFINEQTLSTNNGEIIWRIMNFIK